MRALQEILEAPIDEHVCESLEDAWSRYVSLAARVPRTFDRAVIAGFAADRLAWAFAGGYRSALDRLVPGLPRDAMVALAVTEKDGNTPRAIQTRLTTVEGALVLDGDKRWTTLGPRASELLVAARVEAEGAARPELRVVRVRANAPGVTITPMHDAPFVPEIPHATVTLRGVEVEERDVLLGDGYDEVVKPFRTIEDVHVFGAALGHAVRELRRRTLAGATPEVNDKGRRAIERAAAAIAALDALADARTDAPFAHVTLAGAIEVGGEAFAGLDWVIAPAEDEAAVRLRRDRVLLSVAGKAREARRAKAWSTLSS
jgi:alkylation response protein AidB-like acyl-CoA dehydrogenase